MTQYGLALRWRPPGGLVADSSGRRPMMVIQPEAEKGGRDRLLPVAPDFAEFLEATPKAGLQARCRPGSPGRRNTGLGQALTRLLSRLQSGLWRLSDLGEFSDC